jgi:hypothetical protein
MAETGTTQPIYEGGCHCGEIRYRVTGVAIFAAYCHCRSCTMSSGAPVVGWATFDEKSFAFTKGRPAERLSSPPVRRTFCPTCGSALTYTHAERPDHIDVTLATVDGPVDIAPMCHVWVSEKRPWFTIGDDLPRYSEWPGSTLA